MGFEMKLNLAFVMGLLNAKTRERLSELNTIRNKCSHNWLLNAPVRRGRRATQKKVPLLLYDGRDLHKAEVLKDFVAEFGTAYVKIFGKFYV